MEMIDFFLICFAFLELSNAQPVIEIPSFTKVTVRSTYFVLEWQMKFRHDYQLVATPPTDAGKLDSTKTHNSLPRVYSPYKLSHTSNRKTGLALDRLKPNSAYHITLIAFSSNIWTTFKHFRMDSVYTASPAPNNVKISNVGAKEFDVSWSHDRTGERRITTGYQIDYTSPTGRNGTKRITNVDSRSYSVKDVTPEAKYTVIIRALTASDDVYSDDSVPVIVTKALERNTIPVIISASGGFVLIIGVIGTILGVRHHLKAKRDAKAELPPDPGPRRKTSHHFFWKFLSNLWGTDETVNADATTANTKI